MNCMTLNIYGIKTLKKRGYVKELCNKNMVDFLGLHETRKTHLDHLKIRFMLRNSSFKFACSTARGIRVVFSLFGILMS